MANPQIVPRPGGHSWLKRVDLVDLSLYNRAAQLHSPLLDRVLPRLTNSGNHGALWFAISGALALTGRRRTAMRGLACLAVASTVANIPAKLAVRRTRPILTLVPLPRQLSRQPSSSSFPSGHSASAAAFATGVALESPVLGVPVGLLAAGVAYGRVHTGVHYPGDVAAGIAVGVGSALLVRHIWPVHSDEPATARPADGDAPALADGTGLIVVINETAGSGGRAQAIEDQLRAALAGVEVVRCGEGDDIEASLRKAATHAQALGVMGGDGTINCAAGIALEQGLPLAVLPGGTLNHFAKELGILDVDQVITAVREGTAVAISVGSAAPEEDGLYFLNTFALGVYPEVVKQRERREGAMGKWPAMFVSAIGIAHKGEPVELTIDGTRRKVWTLFAGNGRYHPDGFIPSWRERLDEDCVDIRVIDAERRFSRLRLTLSLLTGQLAHTKVYDQSVAKSLDVRSADGSPLHLARDGEVGDGPPRLTVRSASRKLVVYV